jgi:hypothetical protein
MSRTAESGPPWARGGRGDEIGAMRPLHPVGSSGVVGGARAVALAWALSSGEAQAAAPRDDIFAAYMDATQQLHALDLEASLQTLDRAIEAARDAGVDADPSLAALHAMRAGLLLALQRGDQAVYVACLQGVRLDPLVEAPIELRSVELRATCERARSEAPRPSGGIVHTPPDALADREIEFTIVAGVVVPDDGQLVLYWRRAGSKAPYIALEMTRIGNFGRAVVGPEEHSGEDVEYFLYAFDGSAQPLASAGDREQPLVLRMMESVPDVRPASAPASETTQGPRTAAGLPRLILTLGIGTGLGVARGHAEQTYRQFVDVGTLGAYSRREQACAIARWHAGRSDLPSTSAQFGGVLGQVQESVPQALPMGVEVQQLAGAYDPVTCRQRHPVTVGLASAPLHLEPKVLARVYRGLYVGAFARLQVVTGSRVVTDDPSLDPATSFTRDVTSTRPAGARRRHPFTWAVGVELAYMLGAEQRRLHPFVGLFAGYGWARLRVPLGFANDRNGNSVPDDRERAAVGPLDANDLIDPDTCTAVWPWVAGCTDPDATESARAVTSARPRGDQRVDTVVLGPGFGGVLAGIHYRVTKHFALRAEAKLGAWFPHTASVLADVTLGPALTF